MMRFSDGRSGMAPKGPKGKDGAGGHRRARTGIWGGATLLLLAALITGCGGTERGPGADTLRSVEPGTLKGEVYRALGPGPVDSTRFHGTVEYGYPLEQYLVSGEVAEVFWVPQDGYAPGDSIDWRASTPVLFRNIALLGWGWDEVEPLAEEMGLVFPGMSSWSPRAPREIRDRDDPGGEGDEVGS
jgi:hypothetical protein